MDAVTTVLVNRARAQESVGSMLGASVMAHALLLTIVILTPLSWFGGQPAAPETVIQISLGVEGPVTGGMSTLSGRPVQQVVETQKTIEPVRPPAAREPEMVEPVKNPKKASSAQTDANDPRSRTPTKGKEAESGSAVAQTGVRGTGFGLSTGGGGDGMQLDISDFCCPEYLSTMRRLILSNWSAQQQAQGTTYVRFVVRRDGLITSVEVLRSSGSAGLDYFSQRAIQLVGQFPPLPAGYPEPSLSVRLAFEYRR